MTCFIQLCRTCRAAVDYDCLCRTGDVPSHFYVTSDEWAAFKRGTWPEHPATHTPAPVDQAQDTDDLTATTTLQGAQGGPAASAPAQAQRRALTFLTETPPCRICGKVEGVAQYHPEHPERAICVPCCEAGAKHHDGETGHVFTYVRAEQDRVCDHCGQFAGNTDYYEGER